MPLLSQLRKWANRNTNPATQTDRPGLADETAIAPVLSVWRDIAVHIGRRLVADNIPGVAASLSYTSLLALVPLLSVSLAMLTAFPAFSGAKSLVQDFIFQGLLPTASPAVQQTLTSFISATGKLTAVGVTGLAVTAVLLLTTIEKAFNTIFRASRGRSWGNRLLVYWTVLTLGPLLMGAASAIGGNLASATSDAGVQAGKLLGLGNTRGLWNDVLAGVSDFLPPLLIAACFTILYWAVPSRRIPTRDALIGALLATVAFGLLRLAFLQFFSKGGSYQTIYGALATVPLLLLWMYLTWLVVLTGAVVAALLPDLRDLWNERRRGKVHLSGMFERQPLLLAVGALLALEEAVPQGLSGAALTARLLSDGQDDLLEDMDSLLHRLRTADLVVCDDRGIWHRTLGGDRCTVGQVVRALGYGLPSEVTSGEAVQRAASEPWQGALLDTLQAAQGVFGQQLEVPLSALSAGGMQSRG
ncbi:YihY family inner membrane protein [Insolitispirillum peregrinum]|uniref:UPF0761 membrane protein SAMN05421779_107127 n=1 Tax=Insolitispirillum peregrinum TaxID=80876 RepID=A0A1N7PNP5_9PROT|nr:YihY family inner membrane protein [Insolitispirillum peregrinum]SIT12273.1 membrane protein [Insolitispirillum peregrinum]